MHGGAQVGDFGLSRLMDKESDSLETSTHGTVTHMPPELLMDGRLSRATDIYSFGVILWEIYTARRAFAGLMSHQIFLKITTEGLQLPFPAATPPPYMVHILVIALGICESYQSPSKAPAN